MAHLGQELGKELLEGYKTRAAASQVPGKPLKIAYPREIFTGGTNEVAKAGGVSGHSSSYFLPLQWWLPYLTSQAGWVGCFSAELGAYTVTQVPPEALWPAGPLVVV